MMTRIRQVAQHRDDLILDVEADLDQIGIILEEPEDPTFESAYTDAMAGEVAVIAYRD
jgi:hypothetical protein